jgi:hypothetical protein
LRRGKDIKGKEKRGNYGEYVRKEERKKKNMTEEETKKLTGNGEI